MLGLELELLCCGTPDVSVDSLRDSSRAIGFGTNDETLEWFWRIVTVGVFRASVFYLATYTPYLATSTALPCHLYCPTLQALLPYLATSTALPCELY